jgi:hypothetical protein
VPRTGFKMIGFARAGLHSRRKSDGVESFVTGHGFARAKKRCKIIVLSS